MNTIWYQQDADALLPIVHYKAFFNGLWPYLGDQAEHRMTT
jgi:hypothetical protein